MRALKKILAVLLVFSGGATAQTPGTLEQWQAIAQQETGKTRVCDDTIVCQWPGHLILNTGTNGSFTQSWTVLEKGWVALPGGTGTWPQHVRNNGNSIAVIENDGVPMVFLNSGQHQITGVFANSDVQSIAIPQQTAVWTWRHNNTIVWAPKKDTTLTRTGGMTEENSGNTLQTRVFKNWLDGPVPRVTVAVELNVSGRPREETLPSIIDPQRFVLMGVDSAWPVETLDNGGVRVQVGPGKNVAQLSFRCVAQCDQGFTAGDNTEYWVLTPVADYRQSSWSSSKNIDPQRLSPPVEWEGSWIEVGAGETVSIKEVARGRSQNSQSLNLERHVWWNLNTFGATVFDTISGEHPAQNSLKATAPFVVHSAKNMQTQQPVPVGVVHSAGEIQWHAPELYLNTSGEMAAVPTHLPVGGWNQRFDTVKWVLHLPPGAEVFTTTRVDKSENTWTSRWRVEDVFLILVLMGLAWVVGGKSLCAGVGALSVLAFHVNGFPGWWLGLVLLSGLGLQKISALAVRPWLKWISLALSVCFILASAFFVFDRLNYALYPQTYGEYNHFIEGAASPADVFHQLADMWSVTIIVTGIIPLAALIGGVLILTKLSPTTSRRGWKIFGGVTLIGFAVVVFLGAYVAFGLGSSTIFEGEAGNSMEAGVYMNVDSAASPVAPAPMIEKSKPAEDSNTNPIAVGPSQPRWPVVWETVTLKWNSSVAPAHTFGVYVVPAWLSRLVAVLSALLCVFVAVVGVRKTWNWPMYNISWKKTAAALTLALCSVGPVYAEDKIVEEPTAVSSVEPWWYTKIKTQTQQTHELCSECTTISIARVSRSSTLNITMEVHASTQSIVALPRAGGNEAVLQDVVVNGKPSSAVAEHNGVAHVLLNEGVHTVGLTFALRSGNGVLNWPQKPQTVEVEGAGWSGVTNTTLVADSLGWSSGETTEFKANHLSPFVRVKRVLKMNAQWEVQTTVERIAPDVGSFEVRVPLLPNEQPQTSLDVDNAAVVATFGHSNSEVSWSSTLPVTSEITWTPISSQWGEELWTVQADERWAIDVNGLPSSASNSWNFYPVGAEQMHLKVQQPKGRTGAVARVKHLNMEWSVTQRGRQAQLQFTTEANNGGEVILRIPEQWRLSDTSTGMTLRSDNQVSFTVQPGEQHWRVAFVTDDGAALRSISPQFVFNIPVHNTIIMPKFGDDRRPNRWIVGLGGDGVRPVSMDVVYIVLAAFIGALIGLLPYSPLRPYQWSLLAVGLIHAHMFGLLIVSGLAFLAPHLWTRNTTWKVISGVVGAAVVVWLFFAILGSLGTPPELKLKSIGFGLMWYHDVTAAGAPLPEAIVYSLPLGVYRGLMLVWSLWVVVFVLKTIKHIWNSTRTEPTATPPELP